MRNTVPPSAGADAPSRTQDNKDFMARWIAYGMSLKGKADGFGIEWRGKNFETWMHEVNDAEQWATPEGGNHA